MSISRKKFVVGAAAIVGVLGISVGAFAYWTSTGSGTGSASTGTAADNLVIHGTAPTQLTPGNSSEVTFEIDNPSDFAQQLSVIHLVDVAAYDSEAHAAAGGATGLIPGCGGLNTLAASETSGPDFWMTNVTVDTDDGHIAANAIGQDLTATGTLNMNDLTEQSQNVCKSVFLRLNLTSS